MGALGDLENDQEVFWLATFAGVGIRDCLYVLMLRMQCWKPFKECLKNHQDIYNPCYFAFTIQHWLSQMMFLVAGILCLLLDFGWLGPNFVTSNLRALFFHNIVWDIEIFIRDQECFTAKFRAMYFLLQVVTICLGIGWMVTGVFDHMDGRLGFYALSFLASGLFSTTGHTLAMFTDTSTQLYLKRDASLSLCQRIWRWGLIVAVMVDASLGTKLKWKSASFITVLISGLVIEFVEAYCDGKRIFTLWNTLLSTQNDNIVGSIRGEDSSTESPTAEPTTPMIHRNSLSSTTERLDDSQRKVTLGRIPSFTSSSDEGEHEDTLHLGTVDLEMPRMVNHVPDPPHQQPMWRHRAFTDPGIRLRQSSSSASVDSSPEQGSSNQNHNNNNETVRLSLRDPTYIT